MRVLAAALAATLAAPAWLAAQNRLDDNNLHAWFVYAGDHPLGSSTKWGAHLEAQWRRAKVGTQWQQLLVRPGVNYHINDNLFVGLGWGFIQSHRYGEYPVRAEFPEHRIFQTVQARHKAKGLEWTHRFRQEQRYIGEMSPAAGGGWQVARWRYENRFRYMLRTTIPVSKDKNWFVALQNEVKFNFGKNVVGNHFDQNRAYVALARKLPRSSRIEFGFLEQTVHRRGGLIWEHNHTIQLGVYSTARFRREKR